MPGAAPPFTAVGLKDLGIVIDRNMNLARFFDVVDGNGQCVCQSGGC